MSLNSKKVLLFLILVVGQGLLAYIPVISDQTFEGNSGYIFFLMWVPALSAILTKLIFDKNLKGLGWHIGKIKYLFISYMIPLGCCLVVYSTAWLTKIGSVDFSKIGNGNPDSFAIHLLIYATLGVIGSGLSAAGEEIGWRGFLTPELLTRFSYVKTSLIMGVIWNLYHYPLILFADYNNGVSKLASLVCFTISVFSICFITTWLRIQSGSLWTGVVLHASHNLFVQGVFDIITVDHGSTKLFTTEFGIGLAVQYSLVATYIAYRCIKKSESVDKEMLLQ